MRYIVLAGLLLAAPAYGQDKSEEEAETRPAQMCFPAKGIIKHYRKFDKLDADKKDTVSVKPEARFEIHETGHEYPQRFFIKDGDVETDLPIEADGRVPEFGKLFAASKDAEMCFFDPERAGLLKKEDTVSFSIGMDITFNQASGYHSLAELKDGLKDGKSHYKKMVGAMSFMVPKLTHVILSYEVDDVPVQITAMKDGAAIEGLTSEPFSGTHVIEVAAIEALGADGLKISGGAYTLEPGASIEKMKKLGFGGPDKDEGEDEASEKKAE